MTVEQRPVRLGEAAADLLVLGGRRREGNDGTHLGGLAHAVVSHAHCPVAVVPES